MLKLAVLAVSSMLLASVAQAEVKEDCSAKMNGEIRCECGFHGHLATHSISI